MIFKNTYPNLWYKAEEGLSRNFIDRNDYVRKKKILNYQCFLFLFQQSRKKKTTKQNLRKILGIKSIKTKIENTIEKINKS